MRPSWSLMVYPRATVSTNSSQSLAASSSAEPTVSSSHSDSLSAPIPSSSNSSAAAPSTSSTSSPSPSPSPPSPSPLPPSSTSSIVTFQAPTTSTSTFSPETTSQTPPAIAGNSSIGTSTSLSSTSANVTVTVEVSSNPTNDLSPPQQDASRQGFFSHTGGVAGTFLVIGLFTTSLFLCFFFWIKRRNRRKRATQRVYMQDNYRSLTHSLEDRQTTPEPRASRRSASINRQNSTPALTHSKNNSAERIPFPLIGRSPYQAEPGEYDPYKPEAVNKVYSNDYAEASEYQKYLNELTD